jgi:hypothetical protein
MAVLGFGRLEALASLLWLFGCGGGSIGGALSGDSETGGTVAADGSTDGEGAAGESKGLNDAARENTGGNGADDLSTGGTAAAGEGTGGNDATATTDGGVTDPCGLVDNSEGPQAVALCAPLSDSNTVGCDATSQDPFHGMGHLSLDPNCRYPLGCELNIPHAAHYMDTLCTCVAGGGSYGDAPIWTCAF